TAPLSPYTTLFRSGVGEPPHIGHGIGAEKPRDVAVVRASRDDQRNTPEDGQQCRVPGKDGGLVVEHRGPNDHQQTRDREDLGLNPPQRRETGTYEGESGPGTQLPDACVGEVVRIAALM